MVWRYIDYGNTERADRAQRALDSYIGGDDLTIEDGLGDLLTDLQHLAARHNLDFTDLMVDANKVYQEELSEDEPDRHFPKRGRNGTKGNLMR